MQLYGEQKKFKQKMTYANKLGVPFIVLIGEDEMAQGACSVKDMRSGEQVTIGTGSVVAHIKAGLAQGDEPVILEK